MIQLAVFMLNAFLSLSLIVFLMVVLDMMLGICFVFMDDFDEFFPTFKRLFTIRLPKD